MKVNDAKNVTAVSKRRVWFTGIFAVVVAVVAVIIGVLNINATANLSDKQYSVDTMLSHILALSEKEHSIYDEEALDEVRSYISSTLFAYGIQNEIVTHNGAYVYNEKTDEIVTYRPQNIYAEIPGESGTNILLIAHYDSCGYKIKYGEASDGSHGAMDDGYGVAVVLELARIYASVPHLKNGIKIAFLDAEEVGVVGSEALVNEYADWLADVNLVMNVEGRGSTGPLYLFQTSTHNSRIIDFYHKAGFPYSFSIAADIYNLLPNNTDLSPFLDNGYAGMNFAVLDNLKVYHNAKDVYASVEAKTLARYCNTLLPLLDEYTTQTRYAAVDYFTNGHQTLFFTLLPNVFVSYSAVTGWIAFVLVVALVVTIAILSILKKSVNWKKLLISLGLDLAFMMAACGLGFVVALLACLFSGVKFHLIFVIGVACDGGLLTLLILLMLAAFVVATWFKRKLGITCAEMTLGGLIINTILAIVCAAVVFGGTFMFVIPVLLYALGELAKLLIPHDKAKSIVLATTCAVATVFTVSAYISLIYSLYVTLTFGALGFMTIFAILPMTMCAPQIGALTQSWPTPTKEVAA